MSRAKKKKGRQSQKMSHTAPYMHTKHKAGRLRKRATPVTQINVQFLLFSFSLFVPKKNELNIKS